jgi:hypothetical protein
MEYTLSLALVDFLPVFFAAFGFFYVVRLVSSVFPLQGRIAFLGGLFVVLGGFIKAVWKFLMAFSAGTMDLGWMENALFILMAPGYILLAWSVWQTARSVQGKRTFSVWVLPVTAIVLLFLTSFYLYRLDPASPAWERILLTALVLATLLTGVLLIVFAARLKLSRAAWLFLVNLLTVLIMNGLARQPGQPISLQWIEEVINVVSWLAFALGARMLYQYAQIRFGVDAPAAGQLPAKAR